MRKGTERSPLTYIPNIFNKGAWTSAERKGQSQKLRKPDNYVYAKE